jgi:hypothetical protein
VYKGLTDQDSSWLKVHWNVKLSLLNWAILGKSEQVVTLSKKLHPKLKWVLCFGNPLHELAKYTSQKQNRHEH